MLLDCWQAQQALSCAIDAVSGTHERGRECERLLRAMRDELYRVQTGTVWPTMSTEARRALMDIDFKGGAYPESVSPGLGQMIAERRRDTWAELLGAAAGLCPDVVDLAPFALNCPVLDTTNPTASAIRNARAVRLVQAQHMYKSWRADIDADLESGALWMWCNEGWTTTMLDIAIARGR